MRQKTKANILTMGAALLVGALYSGVAISRPVGSGGRADRGGLVVVGHAAHMLTGAWRD